MERFPSELIYLLVIVGIALFQFLVRRFGPGAAPEAPAPEDPAEPPPPRAAGIRVTTAGVPARPVADGRRAPPPAPHLAPDPSVRRFARRSLIGNRRAMQDAVVMATVLGPCRASAPHEVR